MLQHPGQCTQLLCLHAVHDHLTAAGRSGKKIGPGYDPVAADHKPAVMERQSAFYDQRIRPDPPDRCPHTI